MIEWFIQNRKNIKKCILQTEKSSILVFMLCVICSIISILMPIFNMKLVNLFVYERFEMRHGIYFCFYVVLVVVANCLGYVVQVTRTRVENSMQSYINNTIIEDCIEKKLENYCETESTNTDVLIKSDASLYQQFICIFLFDYPFMAFKVVAVFGILVLLEPIVALTVLCLEVLVTVLQRQLCKPVEMQSCVVRNSLVGFFGVVNDIVGNSSVIKSIGAGSYLKERAKIQFERYAEDRTQQTRYSASASLIIETLLSVNMLSVLGMGSYKIYRGAMSIGALLSLVQYVGLFISVFTSLSENTVMLHSVKGKLKGISDVLAKHVRVEPVFKETPPFDAVRICGLSFCYSEKIIIFDQASATFRRGNLNCICGASGSGKSTLIKLLLGEYSPEKGSLGLTYNEESTGKLKTDMIAYVPQENVFFSDTVWGNIGFNGVGSKEDAYEVCRQCSIYDEIEASENGFNSMVNNSIKNWSGGQMKRLAIARAILQNKEILLLDEPTAGLDMENTEKVLECIKRYAREKLVIVVTHDPSIERCADVVYNIENQKLKRIV